MPHNIHNPQIDETEIRLLRNQVRGSNLRYCEVAFYFI